MGVSAIPAPTAPAPHRWHDSRGFTLIELLVVLLIGVMLITLTVISVNAGLGDRPGREAVRRLHALLQVASEEAILFNRSLGVRFEPDGYTFYRLEEVELPREETAESGGNPFLPDSGDDRPDLPPPTEKRWVALEGDEMLKPRELPESLEIHLDLEDAPVSLERSSLNVRDDEDERIKPQLFITPDGEVAPDFELEIRDRTDMAAPRYYLTINREGELAWREEAS
ncbi:MAG: prepilin-type N-terminal cleavage/methylation domain-containing protein [Pseudomonadota bacterium]